MKIFDEALKSARRKLRYTISELKGHRIQELPVVDVALSHSHEAARLNLVVLGIGRQAMFGGTSTALRFFDGLRKYYPRARIVVLEESARDFRPRDFPGWALAGGTQQCDQTVFYLSEGTDLPVGSGDRFVATQWLTAYYVMKVRERAIEGGLEVGAPFVYLIQDYEPALYGWSSRYVMADATYTIPDKTLAVFNTELLADFFLMKGYSFPRHYVFEPKLNVILRSHLDQQSSRPKRRLLLVYGRPSARRNAFELAFESLRAWASSFPNSQQWEVISLGGKHRDLRLPNGNVVKCGGVVSLERYAQYLNDAAVGLALMVSPHPSYPPLEMAEFGVHTVTNSFANKDLSERSGNFLSVRNANPSTLARALWHCCEAFDAGTFLRDPRPVFLGEEDNEFPFTAEIADELSKSW